jgi:hypothetical protein
MEKQIREIIAQHVGGTYEAKQKCAEEILRLFSVVGRSEQFNCLGGNYAKGIKPCEEWCGEDMCQKPSN